jgi:hypothetical protein
MNTCSVVDRESVGDNNIGLSPTSESHSAPSRMFSKNLPSWAAHGDVAPTVMATASPSTRMSFVTEIPPATDDHSLSFDP